MFSAGATPVISWSFQSGAWENGAAVPLDDRAFRYGMSVFETIAVVGGRALLLTSHLARLRRAAHARGWQKAFIPDSLPELPRDQDAPATGVFRLYLTAGPGGAGDPLSGSLFALFEDCEVGTDFPPLRMVSSAAPYLPEPGGWKTGNYWQNVEASNFARSTGADDALLFNPAGGLVCASMGNIFVGVGGAWETPAIGTGARDGVVRAWVLDHLPVGETFPDAASVARASACFVTNSRIGIRPVSELDGRALRTDVAALQHLYREQVL
ncbi:MAG: aminotransferase class IV [Verrucomicrobiae bacterium]